MKSHQKFKAKYELPFTLLADVEKVVCELYGVWVEKSTFGKKYMGVQRTTFVIGPDGSVRSVITSRQAEDHPVEALAALRASP